MTLNEAVAEWSIDATPEEMQAEIEHLRDAEAVQAAVKQRQRRLRLALSAEVVSAALCLLTLLGLKHTQFDPNWRQARQVESFQQMLRQSVGPNPKYDIVVVPESVGFGNGSGTTITTYRAWANHPTYPLYSLPEGYNIHSAEGLNDEEQETMTPFFMPSRTVYIEFCEAPLTLAPASTFVYYEGLLYRRGWVRKEDVPNVLGGHPFNYYPCWVPNANCDAADLVPLTVSVRSIQAAHGATGFMAGPAGQNYQEVLLFPEGSPLTLDTHAWERYSGTP